MPSTTKTTSQKAAKKTLPRRTPGRPRLEDTGAIEDALLLVAKNEFLECGYGRASMTRIAQTAHMSKTTLYMRYASKAELFSAIINRQIDHLAPASLLASKEESPNLEDGLQLYANHLLKRSFEGDMLGINRLIYSESHRFPELGAAATERTRLGVNRIAEFIRTRAQLDKVPCNDPEIVAEVFIYTIRGWYVSKMLSDNAVPASQREKWVQKAIRTLIASREEW